jgi:hypothetical protein
VAEVGLGHVAWRSVSRSPLWRLPAATGVSCWR